MADPTRRSNTGRRLSVREALHWAQMPSPRYIWPRGRWLQLRGWGDVYAETCAWMFIAALFLSAKTGKQPRRPSTEWIGKRGYVQTTEYYSMPEGKELLSHEKTWRNLQYTSLSERSQSEQAAHCVVPTIGLSGKGKNIETVQRSVVARGCGRGKDEWQSTEDF